MSKKEFLAGLPPFLFAAAAIVSFVLAAYLVLQDKVAAATLLAAVAFVAILLAYFPQLESVNAFAVSVKLRKSLDRADEILSRLKAQSLLNANLAYKTLAWGNRNLRPKAVDKQRILDEIDEQLAALGVSADERDAMKRSYIHFISLDFIALYLQAITYAVEKRMNAVGAEAKEKPNDRKALNAFSDKYEEWWRTGSRVSHEQVPIEGFRAFLHQRTPADMFSADETSAFHKMADRIADHFEASRRRGGYTPDAARFFDDYFDFDQADPGAALYREIFKAN